MAVEQNVGLNPLIPKSVRVLEVTVMQGDGSLATVEMQVVSIADKDGNILRLGNMNDTLERIADRLDNIFEFMEEHS